MARTPTGRRELITEAALNLFVTRGYEATTISDIAETVGTTKAAIAYYFPTKDKFLDEFVDPFLNDLDVAVYPIKQPKFPDDPTELLGRYLDVIIGQHSVACWVDTDPIIQHHPALKPRLDTIDERLIRTITSGSRRKNDRARAHAVIGGIWRPARQMTPHELTTHREEIVKAALDSY